MKLCSMVDFVLEQRNSHIGDVEDFADLICRYALFLKQPLELWMFVPCDENGVIFEEPERIHFSTHFDYVAELDVYKEAKERCLFDGFEYEKKADWYILKFKDCAIWVSWNKSKTIEDLLNHSLEIELTQAAIKNIGL